MTNVDSLSIQIEAGARKANLELDKIVNKLNSVSDAIKSINTNAISSQFAKLSKGLSAIDSGALSKISETAKEAEQSVRKVVDTANKGVKTKISFESSDYQKAINELSQKFSDVGKGFKPVGNLSELESQAEKLSTKLETLMQKEQEIIAIGRKSPESEMFEKLQYNISQTVNKLDVLGEKISLLKGKIQEAGSGNGSNFQIINANSSAQTLDYFVKELEKFDAEMEKNAEKLASLNLLDTPIRNLESNLERLKTLFPEEKGLIDSYAAELDRIKNISIPAPNIDTNRLFERIPESARYSIEQAQSTINDAISRIHINEIPTDSFRNFSKEISEATQKLKELEASGRGMGSAEWDNAYIALQRIKNEANEYKQALNVEASGLERDSERTSSLGNKVEELRRKLSELKSQGLNFGDTDFDRTYSELQNAESQLSKYKSNLLNAQKSNNSFSENASKAFKKVANSIKNMVSSAVSALGRLGSAFIFHKNNANGLSKGILGIGSSASKTVSSVRSLTRQIASASGVYLSLYGAIRAIKGSMEYASSLTEVQNVIDITFGKSKKIIEDFAETSIQQFGLSQLSAKQTAGRFQSMGVALGLPQKEMANMSVELTKLSADMASFYDVSQEDVAKSLQSVFTGTTAPMRKYGVDLTQTTLEEWAHKRGIDAKMKSMSQAEKMMLRYQYVMERTGAAQGDFARTINTWHNQITLLKENFRELSGVIGTGIINAIKPVVQAINSVMGQVISFSKTVINALGKIFGWTYEEGGGATNPAEELAEGMEDVADSTGDAEKEQKKLNKQLSNLDELNNRISAEPSGGAGGGAGAGADEIGAAAGLGEWKSGESVIKKFKSEIDSLYELGQTIGDALKKAMDSIDWDGVYAKAESFGTGLANFLNGLISPGLFSSLGNTIAGGLNAALHFLNSFGITFDWENFGNSIATGINSFFEKFDFGLLASTFNTWANGILTSMIATVQGINWKRIADKIAELINGIDASGISWKLGKLANSLVNAFYTLVSNKKTWAALGKKIADGINGFFSGMNDVDPKTGLTGFQALGKSISDTISGIADTITTALDGVDWDMVGQSIADFIGNIDFEKIVWNLAKLVKSLAKALAKTIKGFWDNSSIQTKIGTAVVGLIAAAKMTGLTNKLGTAIGSVLNGKALKFGKIALGLGLGAAALKLANEGEWTSSILSAVTAFLAAKTFTGNTKLSLKIAAITIALAGGFTLGKKIGEWLSEQLSSEDMSEYRYNFKFTDLFAYDIDEWKQGFQDMWDDLDIDGALDELADDLVSGDFKFTIAGFSFPSYNEWTGSLSDWWGKVEDYWGDKYVTITSEVKEKVNGALEKLHDTWDSIKDKTSELVADAKEAKEGAIDKIKGAWDVVKDKTAELTAAVKEEAGNKLEDIKNAWDSIKDSKAIKTLKQEGKDIIEDAKNTWDSIKNSKAIKTLQQKGKDAINGAKKVWDSIKNSTVVKTLKEKGENVLNRVKKTWDNFTSKTIKLDVVTDLVKAGIKNVVNWINTYIIGNLNKLQIKVAGKTIGINIPTMKVPNFAMGGFPEDGWFRASHGEMMGQFDNGQSVVANNRQITEGISLAVQRGNQESNALMMQEISLLQRQNDLLLGILQKETGISTGELFNAVRQEDYSFYKRNGHGAFSY